MTDGPLLLRVWPDAARRLGIGRDACWRLVHSGDLPHVRVGARYLIPATALEQWVIRSTRSGQHGGEEVP